MVFEKFLNLLTALMCFFLIMVPFYGYVIVYASDSLCFDPPIEIRNEYRPQPFEFEMGQSVEFEISKPNLVGTLSYEVKRVLKDRVLVQGVFTYYIIVLEENDPTPLWDDPITLEKSFWVDGYTYITHSQDYIAFLWNNYIRDSVINHAPDMKQHFKEDCNCISYTAHIPWKKYDRNSANVPTIIKLIGQENVEETKKTSKAAKIEEEALIFVNKILIGMNLPLKFVK